MNIDQLSIQVSPSLLEALGVRAEGPLNYFTLLGVRRGPNEAAVIDQAVLARSRTLRQWQTSPQYGSEAVRLLGAIHRAATILKDPNRQQAYLEELERLERGQSHDPLEELAELARAALMDGQYDLGVRQELAAFAHNNGISNEQALQVLARIQQEIERERASQSRQTPTGEEWEFRIGGQGEEAFLLMLHGIEHEGELDRLSYEQLMNEALRYGIAADRAVELLAEVQQMRYRSMVKRVARGRIVSEAQMRILLPKAQAYGLDQAAAYDIISDYTLSAITPEDIMRGLDQVVVFEQDEINEIIEQRGDNRPAAPARQRLNRGVPPWLGYGVLGLIALAAVAMLAKLGWENRPRLGGGSRPVTIAQQAAQAPTGSTAVAATPAPAPEPDAPAFDFVSLPDPASGLLRLEPERADDPPAFEMLIHEVTCQMYAGYLQATFAEEPPGWGGSGRFPPGAGPLPVTGVTWEQAMAYCRWQATNNGLAPEAVRLPTHAEYLRALRGRTTRGNPSEDDYFNRARLYRLSGPSPASQTQFDKIFIPQVGQIYDLVGNAAEWGFDERRGERVVLGNDYTQPAESSHLEPRWRAPESTHPALGFRYIVIPPASPTP